MGSVGSPSVAVGRPSRPPLVHPDPAAVETCPAGRRAMVAGVPEWPGTGDAEWAKCARNRYSLVGLEPTLGFALPLVVAGVSRIVGEDPAGDVRSAARASAVPSRTTPGSRATAVVRASSRSTVTGVRSSTRAVVAWPTGGVPASQVPGQGLIAGLVARWFGLRVARALVGTWPDPDGVVESSNLAAAGRHRKTVPNPAPLHVQTGRDSQPALRSGCHSAPPCRPSVRPDARVRARNPCRGLKRNVRR